MTTQEKKNPHTVFICFSGKKQVGKDTATNMAVDMLRMSGNKVAVTGFANTLKDMCVDILGLEKENVYGTDEQKNSPSPILWNELPIDIRLKYSNEWIDFGTPDDDEEDLRHRDNGTPVPREGPMTNREVLQVIGTDIFRTMFSYNVWVDSTFRKDWSKYDVVIITDCRFPNEKIAIEQSNGHIIRLTRNTGFTDEHVSETALDGSTFKIQYDNNGTLEDLNNFIESTLRTLNLL